MAHSEKQIHCDDLKKLDQFFIMEYVDPRLNFKKVSIFQIVYFLQEIGHEFCHKLPKNGSLLIKSFNKKISNHLASLNFTLFCGKQVKIYPHPDLNCSSGVVYFPGLNNCTQEEIVEELRPQGVIQCKRLTPHNEPMLILKFNKMELPSHIRIGYDKICVKPFIPLPLRCYDCFSLGGHTKCGNKLCERCGLSAHTGLCSAPTKCVNCDEEHNAFSKHCQIYLLEKDIQRIRVLNNITYQEAKQIVVSNKNLHPSKPQNIPTQSTEDNPLILLKNLSVEIAAISHYLGCEENVRASKKEDESKQTGQTIPKNEQNQKRPMSSKSLTKRPLQSTQKITTKTSSSDSLIRNTLDKAKLKAKMFG